MTETEFSQQLEVLDKAADRVRSVIYAFIVIFVGMLLYAISAYVYPSKQYLFDDVITQATCHRLGPKGEGCEKVWPDIARINGISGPKDDAADDYWKHEVQQFYDSSVAGRTFKLPFVELEADRDFLWLIFPIVGLIGYSIILLALNSLTSIFGYLFERCQDSAHRMRLVQASLVITAPLDTFRGSLTRFHRWVWWGIALLVFSIPLIVGIAIQMDQANFLPAWVYGVKDQHFRYSAAAMKANPITWPFLIKLMIELFMLIIQVMFFTKLIRVVVLLNSLQCKAGQIATSLEGTVG